MTFRRYSAFFAILVMAAGTGLRAQTQIEIGFDAGIRAGANGSDIDM